MLGQLDLQSQSLFAGRYRVLRRIAAGGMGALFEVVHTETQRRRALKVMLPELLANRQLRERFQMEARITANVESEYIVDVFDAGIDEATGMPFLVMELLNGEDLGKFVDTQGALPATQVVSYLRQVASALDKTHAAGIVHRDLKPENLFLTHREDGTPRVKILDFGISKVVTEAQTGGANATRGLGTPLYMAPEQALAQPLSGATDRYALGMIAYTLLVGVPYWQDEASTFDNAITFVVHTSKGAKDSACARALRAGFTLPPAFDAWFRRATDLNPANRFSSAAELVRELATVLAVPLPERATGSQGADVSGALRASALGVAEPMSARTAPGTELSRRTTGSTAGSNKPWLWLTLGGVGLIAALLVAGLALRASGNLNQVASDARSSDAAAVEPPTTSAASTTLPQNGVISAIGASSAPEPTPKPEIRTANSASISPSAARPAVQSPAKASAIAAPKAGSSAPKAGSNAARAGTNSAPKPSSPRPALAPRYTRD